MKDDKYAPEIHLASALRLRGADLIELAGHIMADRRHVGKVTGYNVEQIEKYIADLSAEFAKFKAVQEQAPKQEG